MTRRILLSTILLFFVTELFLQSDAVAQLLRRTTRATTPATKMNDAATELKAVLDAYQTEALELFKAISYSEWDAMVTGKEDDFKRNADAKLAFAKYHSNKEMYEKIVALRKNATGFSAIDARAAQRMELAYRQNQLPPDLIKKIVDTESELSQKFQTFRATMDGKNYTNNDMLEMLDKELDSAKRKQVWEGLKQVGDAVHRQIIELAKIRNEAAKMLGFKNYWEMQVYFQEYETEELLAIFKELDELTTPIFKKMKGEMDAELAAKFNVSVDQLMPWHYDNPFFQQAPPSKEIDPNVFYRDKKKEDIVAAAVKYYRHIGLPYESVLKNSDMYEREGKNQHAFSIDMDTLGDVRNLNNVKPTAEWMDTVLHEGGHGVYSYCCNRDLPFNLRDHAHIFTTEGIAMMFGAKARTPEWMIRFADVDPKAARAAENALKQQRRREQLIFCRWTLVMLHFEKALYENPDANLKTLWWDTVEQYQFLQRPKDRDAADWASKPHFVIAPVYYHNYMMGELFASQLRESLGRIGKNDNPRLGQLLIDKVFYPGASKSWPQFVIDATGQPLSPKAFSKEVK